LSHRCGGSYTGGGIRSFQQTIECSEGITAQSYRKAWDDKRGCWKDKALHHCPRTRLDIEPVNSPEKAAVFESGIITRYTLDDIAKNGQGTTEIRYCKDLDADEAPNVSNDDPDDQGAVGKAEQGSMRARTLYLNKGYGVSVLAAELASSEPMQHIRSY